jgi:hypothetical protein
MLGFDPRTAKPVASPYTDCAIPCPWKSVMARQREATRSAVELFRVSRVSVLKLMSFFMDWYFEAVSFGTCPHIFIPCNWFSVLCSLT